MNTLTVKSIKQNVVGSFTIIKGLLELNYEEIILCLNSNENINLLELEKMSLRLKKIFEIENNLNAILVMFCRDNLLNDVLNSLSEIQLKKLSIYMEQVDKKRDDNMISKSENEKVIKNMNVKK